MKNLMNDLVQVVVEFRFLKKASKISKNSLVIKKLYSFNIKKGYCIFDLFEILNERLKYYKEFVGAKNGYYIILELKENK